MPQTRAASYSAQEQLRNSRPITIRALKPQDRTGLTTAVGRASSQTLYRRFFGAKRHFSEREVEFFTNVDFVNHVALVAEVDEAGQPAIVGGGRFVVIEPGKAELAFTVVDQYQGQGIATVLMRHLGALAREAGVRELVAEVLPENASMLKVFEHSDFPSRVSRERDVVRVTLRLS
jgi:RimJ/RimL family protein N-acetyltransferase